MTNFLQLLIIFSMIIVSSCSTVPNRIPAEVDNVFFEAAFSISKGNLKTKESYEKVVQDYLKSQEIKISELNFKIELVESHGLADNIAYKINLDVDAKTSEMIYKIQHAPGIFNDPIASFTMLDFITRLVFSEELQTPFTTFELYHNAKAGDPIALDSFLKIRNLPNTHFNENDKNVFETPAFLESRKNIENLRTKLAKEIKTLKSERNVEKINRKKALDALDKAPEGKQFRTLVAKGDRVGAADILRQYLPWEEMAPFEKQFWETHLEVMANPVPLEERVMIYRGVDGDYVHRAYAGAKALTEKEAIEQNKAFFMSTLVVKNQGSWNRRLRSLESMNNKFIAMVGESNEYSSVARITTMFGKHSANPNGSPFLSFTPKFSVAEDFGGTRVSAYLMDPRLLNFNYTSFFEAEIEYLVPLTTFPDELVGIVEEKNLDAPDSPYIPRNKILDEKLEKLILKNYGSERQQEVLSKIKKNSFDFFKNEYHDMHDPAIKSIGKSNKLFYKKFLTKQDPKIVLSPEGDLNCKDLIELFWVAN